MKSPSAALATLLLATVPVGCGTDWKAFAWVLTAGVAGQAQSAATQEEGLILRRVWTGREPTFYAASPSPDGRYVTDINWATGNLAVIDLLTGEGRDVTSGGSWTDSVAFAESSVFSPDGTQIAYTWFSDKDWYGIWMVDADGTGPHPLLQERGDSVYYILEDWSSDGRHLLVQSADHQGIELALVATDDGSIRVLKDLGSAYTSLAAFSTDDRFVAYSHPSGAGSGESDIFALTLDGTGEFRLLSGPSDDRLMGWTPDGKSILFYSDREVTQGIWRLPIGQDLSVGEPELLQADVWRLIPLGFSRDAYIYGVSIEQPQVYTAIVDITAGRFIRPPTPVQDVSQGRSQTGDWSPDGQYLAYAARDPLMRSWRIVIRTVTGDETREFPLPLGVAAGIRWTPDSKALWILDTDYEVHRLDLATGRLEKVLCFIIFGRDESTCPGLPSTEGNPSTSDLSPDGTTLYFGRGQTITGNSQIIARDMDSGREREIGTVNSLVSLSVSPDASTLAISDTDRPAGVSRLLTVPTSGGELRELRRSDLRHGFAAGVGPWTPDGRYILFTRDGALWKISSAGGEPQRLVELPAGAGRHLRFHPDGSRIAFNAGEGKAEIWMIQNIPGVGGASGDQPTP
jgi:Tol biopolymer transport system component